MSVRVYGDHYNTCSCRPVMTVDGVMNANETKQRPPSVARPSHRSSGVSSFVPAERLSIYEQYAQQSDCVLCRIIDLTPSS